MNSNFAGKTGDAHDSVQSSDEYFIYCVHVSVPVNTYELRTL